jgi:hemerythrin
VAMSFEWDDELLTGDLEIDTHHQAFFTKAQRFSVANHLGRGAAELQETLDFLKEYARHHFAAEELRMDQSGFPYKSSHQEAHGRFLAALDDFQKRTDDGEDRAQLASELVTFVVGWFRHHIKNADFPLIRHLQGER